MLIMKSSKEWSNIHSDITVLDPYGWDRKNYDYSWFVELISEEEYFSRLSKSTSIKIK